MESRTQGSRPRPRTQKKSEAKAKDSLFEDRTSRGQGQECSRPRPRNKDTSASVLQKKKKGLHKNFSSDLHKKAFSQKIFQAFRKILTIQEIVLSSSRGERERDFFIYQVTRKAKKKTDTLQNHTSVVRKKHHIFPNFSSVSSRDTDSSYVQKSGISSAPRKCVVMITLSWIQISYTLFL